MPPYSRAKGTPLCNTLVDDVVRHLSQTVNVSLACTVVTTLHCVVEQAVNRVAVVLIVLGSVDTALSSDRVSAARRVLYAEVQHVEAHLAQAGCCTGTCQTRTYDDNVELQLVLRVNQALMCLIVGPFLQLSDLQVFWNLFVLP